MCIYLTINIYIAYFKHVLFCNPSESALYFILMTGACLKHTFLNIEMPLMLKMEDNMILKETLMKG